MLMLCFSVSAFSQTAFTLSGSITGEPDAWVKLNYVDADGKAISDSSALHNGEFTFKGNIGGGFLSTFIVYKGVFNPKKINGQNAISFFLEPGNITATGTYDHIKDLKITGPAAQQEYQELSLRIDEMNKELDPVSNNFNRVRSEIKLAKDNNAGDKTIDSLNTVLTSIHKQLEPFAARYENIVRAFVLTHPNSYVSAYEMGVYAGAWPIDTVKRIYNKFSPAVKSSFYGRQIQTTIASIDNNSVHTIAKNFTTTDVNGKPINLADFKGRYVLLDFWASWCVPCREGTQHIISLFKKYHPAGLDVIAVADDDNEPKDWKRAIKKDKTEIWHNVLAGKTNNDNSGLTASISDKFGVNVLPTKILIDKSGTIIGRYDETQTADLDKKLAELFK